MTTPLRFSVCTTNYNCGPVLREHLESVYSQFPEKDFEYLVVDNRSRDESLSILRNWAKSHPNMTVWSKRCSMGAGRELAFRESTSERIVVLDTDVVYSSILRGFLDACRARAREFAVQAIFGASFPREVWIKAGGRRDLNTHEDVDMWIRIWKLGRMRWYPVSLGENRKESGAFGGSDYLSRRYTKVDRILRRLRHEIDLWKTRETLHIDLRAIMQANVIDFGLAPMSDRGIDNRKPLPLTTRVASFVRDVRSILVSEA